MDWLGLSLLPEVKIYLFWVLMSKPKRKLVMLSCAAHRLKDDLLCTGRQTVVSLSKRNNNKAGSWTLLCLATSSISFFSFHHQQNHCITSCHTCFACVRINTVHPLSLPLAPSFISLLICITPFLFTASLLCSHAATVIQPSSYILSHCIYSCTFSTYIPEYLIIIILPQQHVYYCFC